MHFKLPLLNNLVLMRSRSVYFTNAEVESITGVIVISSGSFSAGCSWTVVIITLVIMGSVVAGTGV